MKNSTNCLTDNIIYWSYNIPRVMRLGHIHRHDKKNFHIRWADTSESIWDFSTSAYARRRTHRYPLEEYEDLYELLN